jgi:hypothetical protein
VSFKKREEAASQALAFIVAGLLFLGVVAFLLTRSALPGNSRTLGEANNDAGQDRDADTLADLLAASTGNGWASGADAVTRLGLGAVNGSGLDESHLQALQGALVTSSAANGKVDYPDARAGLAIPANQDFHLKVRQVGNAANGGGVVLNGVRTAYIGHWTSLASITVPLGTSQQIQASAQTQLNQTMLAAAGTERQMLKGLGLTFNDRVFISTISPTILVDLPSPTPDSPILTYLNLPLIAGDVYPDVKSYITANLPGRLSNYDLLVIGSQVDQSSMTPASVKTAIATWVNAGGRLLVLGSDAANYQWLQPIFSVSIVSSTGAVTAPNPQVAALTTPWALNWPTYNTHGLAWSLATNGAGAHYNDFDHVLVQSGSDVLAVSHKGVFGSGYIVLSSFRPGELSATEANHFMANMIVYKGTPAVLDLDYGPDLPQNLPVSASTRSTYTWDSVGGRMALQVTLYTWGAA